MDLREKIITLGKNMHKGFRVLGKRIERRGVYPSQKRVLKVLDREKECNYYFSAWHKDYTFDKYNRRKGIGKKSVTWLSFYGPIPNINSLIDLETLTVHNISKIENLNGLKKLDKLYLKDNQITKIDGLEGLSNLKFLDLSHNKISEIEGLEELSNLKWLILNRNQINKISGLENLTNLEVLNLNQNNIKKIEGLSELKKLKVLGLGYNEISKIEGLGELSNLSILNLSHNKISDMSGIKELDKTNEEFTYTNYDYKLRSLFLNHNKIKKVEGLEKMLYLKDLDLGHNDIQEITIDDERNVKEIGAVSLENVRFWYNESINGSKVAAVLETKAELLSGYNTRHCRNEPGEYRKELKDALLSNSSIVQQCLEKYHREFLDIIRGPRLVRYC